MKMKKTSRATQVLLSLGVVFTSGTLILHSEFPSMPDFLRGGLEGLGMGLMIVGLVKQRREGRRCATPIEAGKDNVIHEISADQCIK